MRIRIGIRDTEPRLTLSAEQPPRLSVHGDFVGGALPEYEGPYSVAPTETAQTLGTEGRAMAADVSVSAIPSDYVGSAIQRRMSGDMAASGGTVTAPAGYYAESASKAVQTGSVAMKRPTLDSAAGEVRSLANVNAGYVALGGQYSGSALILDKQTAKTVTPSESAQTAVEQYRWTTGAVDVAAIPSDYVGSAVPRRDGTDLTASGVTVTVPSGYYAETASKATAPALQSKSVSYTPTESAQGGTVTADAGYYGLSAVTVSVGAIPYADGDGMGYGS